MSRAIGDRVGVIYREREDGVVEFLGYGTYQGLEIPPPDVGGFNFGHPNPKLVLDNGDVTWGCETWWGSEKAVQFQLEGKQVEVVRIVDVRARAAGGNKP